LQRLPVKIDGFGYVVGVARGGGLPGDFFEGGSAAGRHNYDEASKQPDQSLPRPAHHPVDIDDGCLTQVTGWTAE